MDFKTYIQLREEETAALKRFNDSLTITEKQLATAYRQHLLVGLNKSITDESRQMVNVMVMAFIERVRWTTKKYGAISEKEKTTS